MQNEDFVALSRALLQAFSSVLHFAFSDLHFSLFSSW
jgi:hypothetical protein